MRISERTGSIPIFYPHFIIQTIIYAAKGGLDESSPYTRIIKPTFLIIQINYWI